MTGPTDGARTTDDRLVAAAAALFDLLGDPTRMRLLYALVDDGELRVGALAERAGVSESAVSHALRLLRAAKVVASRREGRSILYHLEDSHVRDLLTVARAHLDEDLGIADDRPSSGQAPVGRRGSPR